MLTNLTLFFFLSIQTTTVKKRTRIQDGGTVAWRGRSRYRNMVRFLFTELVFAVIINAATQFTSTAHVLYFNFPVCVLT